ncbi:semaphorin-4F isoform X2 [Amblyraja radiata]|uniref:semaphorin-4F isoform X2 n=1 Tax=Amblyraja radiata TaxID=386614 RepID=UPI0014034C29|nr:semaphorin-4F isoform X2 [Amblyraja radiata]
MKGGRVVVLVVYVAILCPIHVFVLALVKELLPRKTISYNELEQLTSMRSFFKDGRTFTSFLVDEARNRFYVGANDAVYVLNLTSVDRDPFMIEWNVTESEHVSCLRKGKREWKCHNYIRIMEVWNETHVFACGTYAFDPHCAYIKVFGPVDNTENRITGVEKGRRKCPFEPMQPFAATLADGVLFSATAVDFQGKNRAVVKSVGKLEIRTEDSVMWLSDAEFVASTYIREDGGSGDDDKLYFFFSETAQEFEYYKPVRVPRVARVCKGDIGGQKTLQKKWTSFLKARLVCCDKSNAMCFDEIHDVFTLQFDPNNTSSTVFYGVFSTRWDDQDVSAVCAYRIKDVQAAFNGQYMEYRRDADKWSVFRGDIPDPRPGMCITDQLKKRGFNTTLDLPDNVLLFIRDHLLMANYINPIGGKPLLIRRDTLYTKITVQGDGASDGPGSEVFYLGTETGHLHKAVMSGSKVLVVEDYIIFKPDEKVLNIALRKGFVYIGSSTRVVQFPAVNCSRYSRCDACLLARILSCGWDEEKKECIHDRRFLPSVESDSQQANTLCKITKDQAVPLVVQAVKGTTVFLQCHPGSAWSTCNWAISNGNVSNDVNAGGIHITATESSVGDYKCVCVEEGVSILEAFYSLEFGSSPDPLKNTSSVNYLLMFAFLALGIILGVVVHKYGRPWCRKTLASKGGRKREYANVSRDTAVYSLGTPDEDRPLAISQKSESSLNGTSEKEAIYANKEEVNGMNVGSPRNHTISIISCQDETSI